MNYSGTEGTIGTADGVVSSHNNLKQLNKSQFHAANLRDVTHMILNEEEEDDLSPNQTQRQVDPHWEEV